MNIVQFGGVLMNRTITSREAILSASRGMVIESGLQGLNMRNVAKRCGVSVGSVYNYFPSKSDLVVATIESIWIEIIHEYQGCNSQYSFIENVQSIFYSIRRGCEKYPSFFSTHSISIANIDSTKGRQVMNRYFTHIKNGLLEGLNKDEMVKKSTFCEDFTQSDFIDFIFSNLIILLVKNINSCDILIEIVKRTIY